MQEITFPGGQVTIAGVTGTLRLIGLTGGIGSGKSTVARLLAARGFPVLDADQLAREVTAAGTPALAEIAAVWPQVMTSEGGFDRRKLGGIVFADPAARVRLQEITHPRIIALANQRALALARAGHRVAFYEAALLVETGRHRALDGLIVVDAPEPLRVARVAARDNILESEVRARIAAQLPMSEKRRVATQVIDNDTTVASLETKLDAVLASLGIAR